ncbi:MAG: histidinol dehydrogenase [Nanoarchaeota archaeon]
MIDIIGLDSKKLQEIKNRNIDLDKAMDRVRPIIKEVKTFGNKALFKYTKRYDGYIITANTAKITKTEIEKAYKHVSEKTLQALKNAAVNIEKFAKTQMPKQWVKEMQKGVNAGQIIRPIDKVGCYVPAGTYSLPSTALMQIIPAKVAGVKKIIVVSPPRENNYALLVACDLAGADKIFRVGGAQAIAALAYGTETIPKVDKIVGPGNIYVTAAKRQVFGDVGIDMLAGPTEIMIYYNNGNARFIAADMLSQAEHDRLSSAIFVTTNKVLADEVKVEIEKQLDNDIAKESIRKYGAIVIVNTDAEALNFINNFAPEHLEIENISMLRDINNAGAVFVGEYSCESAGDYAVGPSHVLPTLGNARFRGGLSVYDFIKIMSFQKLTKQGLADLSTTIIDIAKVEGLTGHELAVSTRFKNGP